jgi:hypothetical protein
VCGKREAEVQKHLVDPVYPSKRSLSQNGLDRKTRAIDPISGRALWAWKTMKGRAGRDGKEKIQSYGILPLYGESRLLAAGGASRLRDHPWLVGQLWPNKQAISSSSPTTESASTAVERRKAVHKVR